MTCVVGIRTVEGVLLAADSQASNSYSKRNLATPKTVQINDLIGMAYCGSLRLGQILMYYLDRLDGPGLTEDEHRWAVKTLIPEVRALVDEHGSLHIKNNVEHLGEGAFLLAVRGRLFDVYSDFSVEETTHPWAVDGSGADVAVGVLAASKLKEPYKVKDARKLATSAIKAAADYTPFVNNTVTFIQTDLYTADEYERVQRLLG